MSLHGGTQIQTTHSSNRNVSAFLVLILGTVEQMKRLTNSEMSVYRECKRRWWLGHYRGLTPRARTAFGRPTEIGNRVHDALQAYYDPRLRTDPAEYIDASEQADLIDYPLAAIAIRKEADLARGMVEGYLDWLAEEGMDADYEILSSEEEREIPLMEGATLLAKLDVRVEDHNGNRWSIDHKTGASGVEPAILQLNTQALTQHLVEFLALKEQGKETDAAQGTIFNFLKKSQRTARAKPPFYWREPVRHNRDELISHWRHVVAVAKEILETERQLDAGAHPHDVAYPSPSSNCTWKCEFFQVCGMHDDGSDVAAAIDDIYETHDPLERYTSK